MASAHDVARYLIRELSPLSTIKLQKLVYYSQAWHLVWDDEPLFPERIEAWANGPVVPDLFREHRGEFQRTSWKKGSIQNLTPSERGTIDEIIAFYGPQDAFYLSELTHREQPWKEARKGLPAGARGSNEITQASMAEYYGSLV
ncbi:MAG TPA: type II toxin-antitoxin system antitoxin SocA domain-containing protein [Solirubrobacterales bacterium]|nr:type II toxin-antitoxin system antitoxin SocA domain-containing protein [Solirubrobacterales bacterium]